MKQRCVFVYFQISYLTNVNYLCSQLELHLLIGYLFDVHATVYSSVTKLQHGFHVPSFNGKTEFLLEMHPTNLYLYNSRRIIMVMNESHNNVNNRIMDSSVDQGFQGLVPIFCVHCDGSFFFNKNDWLARCPHCRQLSSINPKHSRMRGYIFGGIALVCLVITLSVIFGTLTKVDYGSKGYIALDLFFAILFFYFLLRSISYLRMKVSKIYYQNQSTNGP